MTTAAGDLRRCFPALAKSLGQSDFGTIAAACSRKEIPEGQRMIARGVTTSSLFLVESGTFIAKVRTRSGQTIVGRIGPGRWIGEIALLNPGRSPLTIECEKGAVVWELRQSDFIRLRTKNPASAGRLVQLLLVDMAKRLRASRDHIWNKVSSDGVSGDGGVSAGWLQAAIGRLLHLKKGSP